MNEGSTPYVDEDGDVFWKNKEGKLHRIGGPAIEWANGGGEWWINGKHYTEQEWKRKVKELNSNQ